MNTITILTQSSCASCDQAKLVLSRLSRDYPLRIDEVGLESEEGRVLAERGGVVFAPGILIDGEPFSYGRLSEKKLRQELVRRSGEQE